MIGDKSLRDILHDATLAVATASTLLNPAAGTSAPARNAAAPVSPPPASAEDCVANAYNAILKTELWAQDKSWLQLPDGGAVKNVVISPDRTTATIGIKDGAPTPYVDFARPDWIGRIHRFLGAQVGLDEFTDKSIVPDSLQFRFNGEKQTVDFTYTGRPVDGGSTVTRGPYELSPARGPVDDHGAPQRPIENLWVDAVGGQANRCLGYVINVRGLER